MRFHPTEPQTSLFLPFLLPSLFFGFNFFSVSGVKTSKNSFKAHGISSNVTKTCWGVPQWLPSYISSTTLIPPFPSPHPSAFLCVPYHSPKTFSPGQKKAPDRPGFSRKFSDSFITYSLITDLMGTEGFEINTNIIMI